MRILFLLFGLLFGLLFACSADAQTLVRIPGPGGNSGVAAFGSKVDSKTINFTSAATTGITFTSAVAVGDAIICGWEGNGAITLPAITDGGSTNVYIEAVSGAPNAQVRAFIAVVTLSTGTITVTMTWTTSRTGRFACDAFRGGTQTTTATLLDTVGNVTTGTAQTTASASISPSAAGYLVWMTCRFSASAGTLTANNSYLFGNQQSTQPTLYKLSATTSETPSLNMNSVDYICLPLSIKP